MKKISLMLVAVMLLSAGSLFANDSTTVNPTKKMAIQIGKLLEDNGFDSIPDDLTAKVLFTLNSDREIVVLSVNTKSESMEAFVKNRLNYKKIKVSEYREGRTYIVPVRITAE